MSVHEIAAAGTSIWLDDLSRAKITSADAHALPARIKNSGVVGVTTNPSIFSAAIRKSNHFNPYCFKLLSKKAEAFEICCCLKVFFVWSSIFFTQEHFEVFSKYKRISQVENWLTGGSGLDCLPNLGPEAAGLCSLAKKTAKPTTRFLASDLSMSDSTCLSGTFQ